MAVNERPFAAKVVEARNRAGQSGSKLFRRNSFYAGGEGHLYAFHHGGRWEPQINVGFFAVAEWGRSAIRAGIGFNLDPDRRGPRARGRAGTRRRLPRSISAARVGGLEALLTDWMTANAGFIQYADRQPAIDMLPADAVDWLINNRNAIEQGWVFVGALAVLRPGRACRDDGRSGDAGGLDRCRPSPICCRCGAVSIAKPER